MPEEWHRMLALQKRKCMIYSLKEKEGMLRLYHRKESIAEAAYCSYFGLRQKSYRFEAETAGLVLYQNHENHLRMEIAKKQEQKRKQQELGIFLQFFRMNIHIAEFRRRTLFDRTEDAKKGGKTGETRLKCCLRDRNIGIG